MERKESSDHSGRSESGERDDDEANAWRRRRDQLRRRERAEVESLDGSEHRLGGRGDESGESRRRNRGASAAAPDCSRRSRAASWRQRPRDPRAACEAEWRASLRQRLERRWPGHGSTTRLRCGGGPPVAPTRFQPRRSTTAISSDSLPATRRPGNIEARRLSALPRRG